MTPPDWFGPEVAKTLLILGGGIVLAALIADSAEGQPYPDFYVPDRFEMERIAEDHARLTYHNSADKASFGAPQTVSAGDLTVELHLTISSGPEYLDVIAPEGWVAYPASVSVEDGDTAEIDIRRGVYQGS